jgi:gluconate 2-dehydrogenase gamma chain
MNVQPDEDQPGNTHTRNRRAFLADTGKLAGAGWLALNLPLVLAAGRAAAEQAASGAAWVSVTAEEAVILAAVANQIIPPDDVPGAADLGVVHFIDQALAGFMSGAAETLREGLADLERRALKASPGHGGFAGLPFAEQTALLRDIETTPFFGQMIFLTHCGMFAMPQWGGNRDGAGWALLGFDSRHAWQPPFGYYDAGHHDAERHDAEQHDAEGAAEMGGHGGA